MAARALHVLGACAEHEKTCMARAWCVHMHKADEARVHGKREWRMARSRRIAWSVAYARGECAQKMAAAAAYGCACHDHM